MPENKRKTKTDADELTRLRCAIAINTRWGNAAEVDRYRRELRTLTARKLMVQLSELLKDEDAT